MACVTRIEIKTNTVRTLESKRSLLFICASRNNLTFHRSNFLTFFPSCIYIFMARKLRGSTPCINFERFKRSQFKLAIVPRRTPGESAPCKFCSPHRDCASSYQNRTAIPPVVDVSVLPEPTAPTPFLICPLGQKRAGF